MRSQKSHQSAAAKSVVWITPTYITDPLGGFDLDPCSFDGHPWPVSERRFTEEQDGLLQPWEGRVWLNPPFGSEKWKFLERMVEHNNGVALLPACTETDGFFRLVWPKATAICFLKSRPHFHYADGRRAPFNSGAPIVLVAYGEEKEEFVMNCGLGRSLKL
jgi:hypothetical protein